MIRNATAGQLAMFVLNKNTVNLRPPVEPAGSKERGHDTFTKSKSGKKGNWFELKPHMVLRNVMDILSPLYSEPSAHACASH